MSPRRTRLIPLALAVTAALGALHSPTVLAQSSAPATRVDAPLNLSVPAQPLGAALSELARQARVQLLVRPEWVEGRTSPALTGVTTLNRALDRLLAGTGLQAHVDGSTVVIRREAAPLPREVEAVLPVVVVHATLQGDPLDERMSLSAAKIIIGRDELEAFGDASMGEVIRRMPSISFAGPPGENNDARVRGLAKEYTQILIDGQPAPGRDFAIDQIPAHLVERIEVIRTTTANVDNQGIAGTVNIILRKPSKERVAKWHAVLGTVPDATGNGTTGALGLTFGDATAGGFRYQVDGVAQNRIGVRTKDRLDYNNGAATLTNREQDYELREHRELGLNARLTWQLNAQDEFKLDPRYLYSSENKLRERLKRADLSEAEFMDQTKAREYLGVNGQWQRKVGKDERYTLGFNAQGTESSTDKTERRGTPATPFNALPTFVVGNDDRISERGVSLRGSTQQRVGTDHALDMGVEVSRTQWDLLKLAWRQQSQTDLARTSFSVDETKIALYAQDEILISERHVLTPGLRLEQVTTRTANNQQQAERRSTHLQVSPSLHWLTNLDARTNWRASVTRSIRRPKFEDMAGLTEAKAGTANDPDSVGNPALKPETAWGVETGLERAFSNKAGVASVNLFYRDLQDLIEKRLLQDPQTGRYQQTPVNVAEACTCP